MKSYESFLPDVLPEVPGCPKDLAIRMIRQTVIEFCEKSFVHQITFDPITLRANLTDYDLDAPDGHRVVKIMKVWFQDRPLPPAAPDLINGPEAYRNRIPGLTLEKGSPAAYTQKDFEQVTFLPIPDQTYQAAVTMRVALCPLRDSTQCEDFLYEHWGEQIACGAKARLMINPGKPYTNVDAATLNQGRYVSAVNSALQRAMHGNVRSNLRVQLRRNP